MVVIPMDLSRVLAQLKAELDRIDAAILSLERLQAKESRRGRPSKMLTEMRKIRNPARRMTTVTRSVQRGGIDPS